MILNSKKSSHERIFADFGYVIICILNYQCCEFRFAFFSRQSLFLANTIRLFWRRREIGAIINDMQAPQSKVKTSFEFISFLKSLD